MLPSMLSKLFWGDSRATEVEADGVEIKHTTREEAGDWLLISCQNSSGENCGCPNYAPKLVAAVL